MLRLLANQNAAAGYKAFFLNPLLAMTTPYPIATHLDLDDSKMHVKSWINRWPGWSLTSVEERAFVFTRTVTPNMGTAIMLLLLGIIPGLLYLLTGARKQTINVYFKPAKKNDTELLVEAGRETGRWGPSLLQYLAAFDHKATGPDGSPSIVPPVGPTEVSNKAVILVLIGVVIYAIILVIAIHAGASA